MAVVFSFNEAELVECATGRSAAVGDQERLFCESCCLQEGGDGSRTGLGKTVASAAAADDDDDDASAASAALLDLKRAAPENEARGKETNS